MDFKTTPNEQSKNSRYCIFTILMTQLPIAFMLGVNLAVLNTASPAIEDFINETYVERHKVYPDNEFVRLILTLTHSCLVWGSVIGAVVMNIALEKLSRKGSVLFLHVINVLGVILMGPVAKFGKSYEALIIGRFVSGIARGLGFSTGMVVVAETTCRRQLGKFQSPFAVIILLACTIGAGLGHNKVLGTLELWAWCVCASGVTSIMYFCCYPFLPETPVYLLKEGKLEEALITLRKLRTRGKVEDELEILKNEIEVRASSKTLTLKEIMKQSHLRMQFFVALTVMNTVQLVGVQGIMMYSDSLFLQAGVPKEYVTFATMGMYMQTVVAFSLYVPLHRKFGTKKLFITGLLINGIGYIILTIAQALHEDIPWTSYLALAAMFTCFFGLQFGPQLCMHSLPSELTTASSRPTVAYFSGCVFWILGSIIAFVLPYSVAAWKAVAYVPFTVIAVVLTVLSVFMIPETNKRTTAHIQASFRKKSSQSFSVLFSLGGKISESGGEKCEVYQNENFNEYSSKVPQ